jgi:hypothetical protein
MVAGVLKAAVVIKPVELQHKKHLLDLRLMGLAVVLR